ncbi:MAG: hypothetical protein V4557_10900 [Bacteroidota bacterium]
MKTLLIFLCCIITAGINAQSTVNKSYPVKAGQKIEISFDFPNVKVSTWDRNEVSIVAHVSINDGENDSAFELEDKSTDAMVNIKSRIRNIDKLPHRYTITGRDGKKTIFRTKEDYKAFRSANTIDYSTISEGPDMDISIEIKVPANTPTYIKSEYGRIDAVFDDHFLKVPLTLVSTFGRVDVSVPVAVKANVNMKTSHGEILASKDLKIDIERALAKDDLLSFSNKDIKGKLNGGGTELSLQSDFGKIYLRKTN